ncbi:hypothetical protein [Pseudomonas sp. 22 E 5]|jgi:hypothetical protein|nr:hypothetical protein PspCFBP13506_21035 [Pseudomonas sp. CFBP13506]CRM43759.1 hypothetical protein [Pseudomonas sp. 31 E 5]CRM61079.1 hypothetical protein [Pseudomonas sp. 31 E 6]CRM91370.1 hypothetical protein [Pseudomonas sp. 22 E 5]
MPMTFYGLSIVVDRVGLKGSLQALCQSGASLLSRLRKAFNRAQHLRLRLQVVRLASKQRTCPRRFTDAACGERACPAQYSKPRASPKAAYATGWKSWRVTC